MYKIERTDYGVKLTFGGTIERAEMAAWVAESEKSLVGMPAQFGVFVDMRTLHPLSKEAEAEMEKGQKLFKAKGMIRSAVILEKSITTLQFKRIAKETGIYQWERYISAENNPQWEEKGLRWITKGVDPDA